MTAREAAIVSAYTGYMLGRFEYVQEYADEVLGRATWSHEFGSREFAAELRNAAKEDFLALHAEVTAITTHRWPEPRVVQ